MSVAETGSIAGLSAHLPQKPHGVHKATTSLLAEYTPCSAFWVCFDYAIGGDINQFADLLPTVWLNE